MTLNMNNHTLSYKINDKDYGIVTDELDEKKYRLIVSMLYADEAIELL